MTGAQLILTVFGFAGVLVLAGTVAGEYEAHQARKRRANDA